MLKEKRRNIATALTVTGLYLLVAVVFTYPLATKLGSHGFGFDEDAPYHIWHNWWLKFSLFNLKQSPLWTDYIFHPQKIPLIYDANSFVFGSLTLPLQMFFSVLTASNVVFLISFALSGLAMYLLTRSLISNSLVSFLSGVIFAFSPYTLAQAMDGHTNLTTTWIIPLYTLCLIKSLDLDTKREKKFPVLGGLFAGLQLYSDFTYTTFLLVETAFILAFFIFRLSSFKITSAVSVLKHSVKNLALIAMVATVMSLPLLAEVVRVSRTGFRVGSPLWVQNEWSADLKAYLWPPDRSTFFKALAYTPIRGTVEGTAFPGYTILTLVFLVIIGKLVKRPDRLLERGENDKIRWTGGGLWLFLSVGFFLLSLGPSLHYDGKFQFDFWGLKNVVLPLPWLLLHKIPLVGEVQEPARLNPFLMLSLTVTVSLFLEQLTKKFKSNKLKFALVAFANLIIVLEYSPVPFPLTDLRPPEVFKTIYQDKGKFSVLILPIGFNSGNIALGKSPIGSLQYYQVIHQHPSFRGTVARLPAWAFDYYRKIPLIKFLLNSTAKPDKDDLDKAKVAVVLKDQLDIKYIVVHKNKYEGETYSRVLEVLEKTLDLEKVGEESGVIAYRLK